MAVFPILQDRIGIAIISLWRLSCHTDYGQSTSSSHSVMIPFLVFSLAAMGLNIVTGYTGLISLGTGGVHGGGRLLPATS